MGVVGLEPTTHWLTVMRSNQTELSSQRKQVTMQTVIVNTATCEKGEIMKKEKFLSEISMLSFIKPHIKPVARRYNVSTLSVFICRIGFKR